MAIHQLQLDRNLFLDSSFAIALLNKQDRFHDHALEISYAIEESKLRITTTRAVLLEIGNSLSRPPIRWDAIQFLESLEQASQSTIVPLTEDVYSSAWALYSKYLDKEWSLVDCISFVVMRDRKLRQALTADIHFEQAGFQALLRTDS
jgi:uncharacterized protein